MTLQEETQNKKRLLEYLVRLASDGVTPLIEKQVIGMLDNTLDLFTHLVKEGMFPKIQRTTVNKRVVKENRRIRDIKFLKYPPAEFVKSYGRCNKPGMSMLYACFDPITAVNELRPDVGDLVTTTTWRAKPNAFMKYCPIFRVQPKGDVVNPRTLEYNQEFERELRKKPEFLWEPTKLIVDFVAQEFSRRLPPGNHLDYVFTGYFADKILNQFFDGSIDAIYYPSVKGNLSFFNIAIKPEVFDRCYELVEVHDSIVTSVPREPDGGCMSAGLGTSKAFDFAGGKIFWPEDSEGGHTKQNLARWQMNYGLKLD